MEWTDLAQDTDMWRDIVNMVIFSLGKELAACVGGLGGWVVGWLVRRSVST